MTWFLGLLAFWIALLLLYDLSRGDDGSTPL